MSIRDLARCALVSAALAAGFGLLLLIGCGGPRGSLDSIKVIQHRENEDEARGLVRIVGIARNTGTERTPKCELVVTLRGRTGSLRGQNRTPLPALKPGAQILFSLAVTSHGKVDAVDFVPVAPRAEAETEGAATSANAPGERGQADGGGE